MPPGLVQRPRSAIAVISSRLRIGVPDFLSTAAAASQALSRLGFAPFFFVAFAVGLAFAAGFAFLAAWAFVPFFFEVPFVFFVFLVFVAIIRLLSKGTAASTRRGVVR